METFPAFEWLFFNILLKNNRLAGYKKGAYIGQNCSYVVD